MIISGFGRLAEIWWSVCKSKSQRCLCVSFPWIDARLCIYRLFVWSNLNFLQYSKWITKPTQSCLVLYSFSANLLYSLIICDFVAYYLFLFYMKNKITSTKEYWKRIPSNSDERKCIKFSCSSELVWLYFFFHYCSIVFVSNIPWYL